MEPKWPAESLQALYDVLQAERETEDPDDLPGRFAAILRHAFRARSARVHLLGYGKAAGLARRRYIEAGSEAGRLILDPKMRSRHGSYWSVPFFSGRRIAGVVQLGFNRACRWQRHELRLIDAIAQRCLAAVERSRMTRDLAAREQEVRRLAKQVTRIEEEERRRISRELHDETGQSLLFIRLQLERMERRVPELSEVRQVVERTIGEIRRVIASLSPAVLEQLGLAAAVRQLTDRFRELYPARVSLRMPALGRYARDTETMAYRLLQECYQNIAKHSGASRVKVCLHAADEYLELSVSDDGAGFDLQSAAAKKNSFGLTGMKERVALLGGEFRIKSAPGLGTSVRIRLPVTTQEHGENSSIPYR